MLGWIKEKTTFAKIAGKWFDATQMNPGDNGQISIFASSLIKNQYFRLEDAWLTSLVNWTFHSPNPEFKFLLANGIIRFLDIYEFTIPFDPEVRKASRQVSESIIQDGVLSGYPDSTSKNYFPRSQKDSDTALLKRLPAGARVSLASGSAWDDKKPLTGLAKEIYDDMQDNLHPAPAALRNAPIEIKICCYCGRKIRFDSETCGYPDCGLDPDQKVMERYGITFDGEKYRFLNHSFSKRIDAIKFAKMKLKSV